MYKCPYCKRLFENATKQRCPHCAKVVLTPGFFKAIPRKIEDSEEPLPLAPARRRVQPPKVFSLLGHSGFKVLIILLLLMMAGAALVNRAKNPPGNTNAHKTDRARLSLANLRVALELVKADTGAYPAPSEGLAALIHPPSSGTGWKGPYVFELKNDLWGVPFQYDLTPEGPVLFGCGPDRLPITSDDIVVQQSDIAIDQPGGTLYAVIVFRDGTRKIIREQVNAEHAIPAELIPES
jgi:general secretion pathway protein G